MNFRAQLAVLSAEGIQEEHQGTTELRWPGFHLSFAHTIILDVTKGRGKAPRRMLCVPQRSIKELESSASWAVAKASGTNRHGRRTTRIEA